MTIGTRTTGWTGEYWTESGSGPSFFNWTEKKWSGDDYASRQKSTDPTIPEPRQRLCDAAAGKEIVQVDLGPPKLPRYKRGEKPKRAYVEDHPYTVRFFKRTDYPFRLRGPYGYNQSQNHRHGGWQPTVFENDAACVADVQNKVLGRLRDKVAGTGWNAAVTAAESREALRMITNSATKLYKAVRAVKRLNFVSAADILKGTATYRKEGRDYRPNPVATNWLELQYGWLPLLSDVKDASEFLAHHLNFPLEQRYRVSAKTHVGRAKPSNVGMYAYEKEEFLYRRTIIAKLREKNVYQLAGLLDPLSVAWELLPFSFVFDWFIPVGTWLENRGLASSLEGKYVITTKASKRVWGARFANGYYVGPEWPYYKPEYEDIDLTREIFTNLPVPTPHVSGLGQMLEWKRAANAVSLLLALNPRSTPGYKASRDDLA